MRTECGIERHERPFSVGSNGVFAAGRLRLDAFRREDAGTLTVFGIVILVMILIIGGIGVDIMRFEQVRTRVQNTEDTAVLAATNLNQTLDAKSVVQDYFAKAGLSNYLKSVTVTSSTTFREVVANAQAVVPTFFMKLENINSLQANADSTAQESIGNVEVAVALDNSGSMSQNTTSSTTTTTCTTSGGKNKYQSCKTTSTPITKIAALITAADSFVDTMFSSVSPGALTMSIFPYDSHVALGTDLVSRLNVTSEQTATTCIDLLPSDFSSTAVSTTASLQRSGYFDAQNSVLATGTKTINSECTVDPKRYAIAFSASASDLKAKINSMYAGGYTSIESGVKWAAATLDPAFQPVVNSMISSGKLTSQYSGRPTSFGDKTHMKVLVIMSDGENTQRYQLNPGFYSGNSGVYNNSTDTSNYSFYDKTKGAKPYFWTWNNSWQATPYQKGATYQTCTTTSSGTTCTTSTVTNTGTATQLTYPQLWALMSVDYFDSKIISPAYGSSAVSTWYNKIVDSVSATQMDTYLNSICSAAKANGILIYSIGFQTSSHGQSVLTSCATAPSYYFNVQGTEISAAFSAIASSIVRLRLTQ